MLDLALFHLTHDDREREAAADLRRRQFAKSLQGATSPRPGQVPPSPVAPRRVGIVARLAER